MQASRISVAWLLRYLILSATESKDKAPFWLFR